MIAGDKSHEGYFAPQDFYPMTPFIGSPTTVHNEFGKNDPHTYCSPIDPEMLDLTRSAVARLEYLIRYRLLDQRLLDVLPELNDAIRKYDISDQVRYVVRAAIKGDAIWAKEHFFLQGTISIFCYRNGRNIIRNGM